MTLEVGSLDCALASRTLSHLRCALWATMGIILMSSQAPACLENLVAHETLDGRVPCTCACPRCTLGCHHDIRTLQTWSARTTIREVFSSCSVFKSSAFELLGQPPCVKVLLQIIILPTLELFRHHGIFLTQIGDLFHKVLFPGLVWFDLLFQLLLIQGSYQSSDIIFC